MKPGGAPPPGGGGNAPAWLGGVGKPAGGNPAGGKPGPPKPGGGPTFSVSVDLLEQSEEILPPRPLGNGGAPGNPPKVGGAPPTPAAGP